MDVMSLPQLEVQKFGLGKTLVFVDNNHLIPLDMPCPDEVVGQQVLPILEEQHATELIAKSKTEIENYNYRLLLEEDNRKLTRKLGISLALFGSVPLVGALALARNNPELNDADLKANTIMIITGTLAIGAMTGFFMYRHRTQSNREAHRLLVDQEKAVKKLDRKAELFNRLFKF